MMHGLDFDCHELNRVELSCIDLELDWLEWNSIQVAWIWDWVDLNWIELYWHVLSWIGFNWILLNWIYLTWLALTWMEMNWTEMNCVELNWNALNSIVLKSSGKWLNWVGNHRTELELNWHWFEWHAIEIDLTWIGNGLTWTWIGVGLNWIDLTWVCLIRLELNWVELCLSELNWIELNWLYIELDWTDLT